MTANKNKEHWLDEFVPYLIYRITNQLNQNLQSRLKRSGVNIARWRVLAVLKGKGRMNIGQIVKRTIIKQPTVSRIVNQLENEGLASREIFNEDSRFVQVLLTEAGEKAFNEIYPTAARHQDLALDGFTQREITTLIDFLERIQRNISPNDLN